MRSILRVRKKTRSFIIEVRECFQQSQRLILLFKNYVKILSDYLEIETFEKFKFGKKELNLPYQLDRKRVFEGVLKTIGSKSMPT